MRFRISGKVYETQSLDSPLDNILLDLDQLLSDPDQYDLAHFEQVAIGFFDQAGDDPALHNRFFETFTAVSQVYFESEHWHKAERLLGIAVRPALEWELHHPGSFIHKGTPFYYWGMAAICRGELDRGYTLMHQALQEDIRTSNNQHPVTPAFAFATLDYDNVDQAFRIWSVLQAEFLDKFLEAYRSSRGRNLSLNQFRTQFLMTPPDWDTIFLFAYTLGRMFLIDKIPAYALQNAFASQLEIGLLFDMIMVTEAAIRAKNPNPNQVYFPQQAAFLANRSGLGLNQNQLQAEVNPQCRGANFEPTLLALLDGRFRFQDGSSATGLVADLAVAYALRNRSAHSVLSIPGVWQRFSDIQQSVLNTLFLAVEVLY